MASNKQAKVVFLLDLHSLNYGHSWPQVIFDTCCRILLCHVRLMETSEKCGFINHLLNVQWSYQLITSEHASLKRSSFQELQIENLNNFRDDLLKHHAHLSSDHTHRGTTKSLYNKLAIILQDYLWEEPSLSTPRPLKERKRNRKSSLLPVSQVDHMTNHVYIISEVVSGGGGVVSQEDIIKEVFPLPVKNQLMKKGIKLTVIWTPINNKVQFNMTLLREHLLSTDGDVIPLSALVTPPTTTPTVINDLILPPETFINRPGGRMPCPFSLHHTLYDQNGSIICLLATKSFIPTNNNSLLEGVAMRFNLINTIQNRDIPLSHLLLSDTVCCTGIQQGEILSCSFKELSLQSRQNDASLILVSADEQQVIILQFVSSLLATLTPLSHEYYHCYKLPVTNAPSPVTNAPSPVTSAPQPVTNVPPPVTNAPSLVTSEPSLVTGVPSPVTNVPLLAASAPLPVTSASSLVTSVPSPVTNVPLLVTSVPQPVTSIPSSMTNIPSPVASALQPVTSVPLQMTNVPSSTTNILSLVASAPQPVTSVPSPMTSAPLPMTNAPSPITNIFSSMTNSPQPVASVPSPVTSAPQPVTSAPSPITNILSPVTSAPQPVTIILSPVTSAPSLMTSAPSPITNILSPMTKSPQPVANASSLVTHVPQPVTNVSYPSDRDIFLASRKVSSTHPPFTWQYMTQWASFTPHFGVSSELFYKLKECHSMIGEDEKASRRNTLHQLQKLYTPNLFINEEEKEGPLDANNDKGQILFEDILANLSINLSNIKFNDAHSILASVKEHVTVFNTSCTNACTTASSKDVTLELMWAELSEHVLMNDVQLQDYHNERNSQHILKNGCILQILLHLECFNICQPSLDEGDETIINNVVQLLRKLSLLTSPLQMGQLLKEVILPEYGTSSCQVLLRHVFTEMMLPLPVCLSLPSPQSSLVSNASSQSCDSDGKRGGGGEGVTRCLPRSLEMAFNDEESQHQKPTLARHTSFQGPLRGMSRQISISKKAKVLSSVESPKKVRRSLFSPSTSIDETNVVKKRKTKHEKDDVVVMETPVKKRVDNYRLYKLQRMRSRIGGEDSSLSVVEESPQRSFYSSKLVKNNKEETIQFNTPPYSRVTGSAMLGLNKEPSPAALHSLLHGEWVSPLAQTTPTMTTPTNSITTPQSPELFQDIPKPYTSTAGSLVYVTENPLKGVELNSTHVTTPLSTNKRMGPILFNYSTTPLHAVIKSSHPTTPLRINSGSSHPTTPLRINSGSSHPTTPLRINSGSSYPITPLKSILRTPDTPKSSKRKAVSFSDKDDISPPPSFEDYNDSPSMMAFNLRTPTKGDDIPPNDKRTSFSGIFLN